MSIWEETPGQTKDTLERLYLSAGLGMSWCPPEELVEVAVERSVWVSLLRVFPRRHANINNGLLYHYIGSAMMWQLV